MLLLLQCTSTLVIGGLGTFSNLIIKVFGFLTLQTQLLNIVQGVITIIVMIGSAALGTKLKKTRLVMLVGIKIFFNFHTIDLNTSQIWTIPAIVDTKPVKHNAGGLLIAFYCTQFFLAQGNLIFLLISRNIAGQTKKGMTLTMTFLAWAAGNMVAPQIFQSSDAPRYRYGFIAHLCLYYIYCCIVAFTRGLLMMQNRKKRAATAAAAGQEAQSDEKISHSLAFIDLTDRENRISDMCINMSFSELPRALE